jgi:hypothetical protein
MTSASVLAYPYVRGKALTAYKHKPEKQKGTPDALDHQYHINLSHAETTQNRGKQLRPGFNGRLITKEFWLSV